MIKSNDQRQSEMTKKIREVFNYDGAIYSDLRTDGRRYKLASYERSTRTAKEKVNALNKFFSKKKMNAEAYIQKATNDNMWDNVPCVKVTF